MADEWEVGTVVVKDESRRFGLPAFKMLGASWGVYRAVCDRIGGQPHWETVGDLRARIAGEAHGVGLLTATAGNHGRAVARMGRWLGLPTLVVVPAGTGPEVSAAIAGEGADVLHLDASYDETVAHAAALADAHRRYLLVQDSAWPGYERIAQWIVEGYQTLFGEVDDQLAGSGGGGPVADLVVVPIGVGSLASAAVRHYRAPGPARPALLGVEPLAAACALESLRCGRPVRVATGPTIMAGLNAGTLSSTAWPLLRDGLDAATAVSDDAALSAHTRLSGLGVATGYCGSATLAGVTAALSAPGGDRLRAVLGLTPSSTVVLIATDGDPRAESRARP